MPTRRILLRLAGGIAPVALLGLVLVSAPRGPRAEPISPSVVPPQVAAAITLAVDPPPALAADGSVHRLLAWADRDLPAALVWTSGFVVREERQRLQAALCFHLAERSPSAAAELAARLALDEAEEDVVSGIVIRWSDDDPAAALAWTLAQANDARRSRCLSPFVDRLASVAPREAAELVAEAMPPGPEQARATLAVVGAWAARDFPAALDWVSRLSDEDLRAAATSALVGVEYSSVGFSAPASDLKR